jgi:hypothetical protein
MLDFECPKCNYVHKMLVEDPMKSVSGWQNSGLNAPK